MLKRVFIIVLAILAFACTGCNRKAKQQEVYPVLPSLQITMTSLQYDSILNDQENKVSVFALLLDAQGDTLFRGESYFKTRGNDSFKERKKPFTIKFPKKQKLFKLNRNKTFVLLANACDESHIRNAIGLDMARAFGLPASNYTYLTLYINGSYKGLYQMTNKVDVGKNALDITDLDKLNEWANPNPLETYEWYGHGRKKQVIQRKGVLLDNNPDDITGGYLLDNVGPPGQYSKTLSGFVSEAEDNVRVLSPKYASPQELDYISKRYNDMEAAVHAPDGNHPVTGQHYSEYLDVESFARYYLLNELLENADGGWASFMMYKETDSIDPKFYAGPAWDYDRILNNPRFLKNSIAFANEFVVKRKKGVTGIAFSGGLLYHLCQHLDFQQAVRNIYLNELSPICHDYLERSPFDSLVALLSHEADQDNMVYGTRHSGKYATGASRATDFLRKRIAFFDWYYSTNEDEQVIVYYESANERTRKFYYPLGEAIQAPQLEVLYNNTSIYEMFYPGTDSLVSDGTVFQTSQKLELRKREPTKREVQLRRVKKKLRKIGLDF
jgi:hypothetical protein